MTTFSKNKMRRRRKYNSKKAKMQKCKMQQQQTRKKAHMTETVHERHMAVISPVAERMDAMAAVSPGYVWAWVLYFRSSTDPSLHRTCDGQSEEEHAR